MAGVVSTQAEVEQAGEVQEVGGCLQAGRGFGPGGLGVWLAFDF